eukprot:14264710-Alexandrium_andersonii.AAC.1
METSQYCPFAGAGSFAGCTSIVAEATSIVVFRAREADPRPALRRSPPSMQPTSTTSPEAPPPDKA